MVNTVKTQAYYVINIDLRGRLIFWNGYRNAFIMKGF